MPSGPSRVERFEYGGATLLDEIIETVEVIEAADVTGIRRAPAHMVFLHGWGASRESLRGIATLFQNRHTVHLIDLPGFGEAPPPPPDWDTSRYADLVEQHLARHAPGPVVLVGHSFGARVSILLAARRPPALLAVVLMAAPGLPAPLLSPVRLRRSAIRWLRKALYLVRPAAGQGAIDWHTRTFGSTDYLAAGPLRQIFVRIVGEDYSAAAAAIQCPVLLLWGAEDRETPPWLAHRFNQLMNGRATVVVLPHKDHHLYAGTGAHLCAFKIRSWLEAHG